MTTRLRPVTYLTGPGSDTNPPTPLTPAGSAGPVKCCPRHSGVVLGGGPVVFTCPTTGHTVYAADLPHEVTRPLIRIDTETGIEPERRAA
jgi:hypothetical protein